LKIKVKLSILVIGIMAVIIMGVAIAGFSVLLLRRASIISMEMNSRLIHHLADKQIEYLRGRKDGYLKILHTLAQIMKEYEDIPAEMRRDIFDSLLYSAIAYEQAMITMYTVWKPNAIDAMDASFMARPGSCPETGQFASAFSRETGEVIHRLSGDLENAMEFLNGPNSRNDRVEHLVPGMVAGDDAYLLSLMVPIVSPRTNEVVGGVGGTLAIGMMQAIVERAIDYYEEIAVKAIYAGDGRILASYRPDRIGRSLIDADTIYGDCIYDAYQAVLDGRESEFKSYYDTLGANVIMVMAPFTIGNSGATWTVMVGAKEEHLMEEIQSMTKLTIILAVLSMFVSGVIIFSILVFITRPMIIVTERLKKVSAAKGILPDKFS